MWKIFDNYFCHKTNNKIKNYAIHLMWIMKQKNEKLPYISTHEDSESFATKVLGPAIKWARANPEAFVNIWYDSQLITDQALNNSQSALQELLIRTGIKNVILSDIRILPAVRENPDIFTPQVPIYFRVDLLKLILLVHSIEVEENDVAIFSDLEVGDVRRAKDRMNYQELFNRATIKNLLDVGFVINGSWGTQENQFLYLYKKPVMVDTIRLIINSSMARAVHFLNQAKENLSNITQAVYSTMMNDIMPFYRAALNGMTLNADLGQNDYREWGHIVNFSQMVINKINNRLIKNIAEDELKLPRRKYMVRMSGWE
jgi:hypothetical protein